MCSGCTARNGVVLVAPLGLVETQGHCRGGPVDPRLGEPEKIPRRTKQKSSVELRKKKPPRASPTAPATAPLQEPRCARARGAPAPEPATATAAAARETAGLLRGLERLHQEGLCPRYGASSECGLDEREKSSLRLIASAIRCRKRSKNSDIAKIARCGGSSQCLERA